MDRLPVHRAPGRPHRRSGHGLGGRQGGVPARPTPPIWPAPTPPTSSSSLTTTRPSDRLRQRLRPGGHQPDRPPPPGRARATVVGFDGNLARSPVHPRPPDPRRVAADRRGESGRPLQHRGPDPGARGATGRSGAASTRRWSTGRRPSELGLHVGSSGRTGLSTVRHPDQRQRQRRRPPGPWPGSTGRDHPVQRPGHRGPGGHPRRRVRAALHPGPHPPAGAARTPPTRRRRCNWRAGARRRRHGHRPGVPPTTPRAEQPTRSPLIPRRSWHGHGGPSGPEAITLEVFGLLAGLAALLIGAQALLRQLRLGAADRAVLRSLGAAPAMLWATACRDLVSILAGTVLAVGVAVLLSTARPHSDRSARSTPDRGSAPTGSCWASAPSALVVGLGTVAMVAAGPGVPRTRASRRPPAGSGESVVVGAAANAGLSVPAVTGLRFALEPGTGRSAVPVRSAIVGTVLAGLILTATFTFGSQPRPAWSPIRRCTAGTGTTRCCRASPAPRTSRPDQTAHLPRPRLPRLGVDRGQLRHRGARRAVRPGHGHQHPNPRVAPPAAVRARPRGRRSGRPRRGHPRRNSTSSVGDTGGPGQTRGGTRHTLTIVGTATMPTAGQGGSAHLEMGSGALRVELPVLDRHPQPPGRSDPRAQRRPRADRGGAGLPGGAALALRRSGARDQCPRRRRPAGRGRDHRAQRPAEIVNDGSIQDHPRLPRPGPGPRRGGGPRAHPGGLGPAAPARSRAAQDARTSPVASWPPSCAGSRPSPWPWAWWWASRSASCWAGSCGTCSPTRSTPCSAPSGTRPGGGGSSPCGGPGAGQRGGGRPRRIAARHPDRPLAAGRVARRPAPPAGGP